MKDVRVRRVPKVGKDDDETKTEPELSKYLADFCTLTFVNGTGNLIREGVHDDQLVRNIFRVDKFSAAMTGTVLPKNKGDKLKNQTWKNRGNSKDTHLRSEWRLRAADDVFVRPQMNMHRTQLSFLKPGRPSSCVHNSRKNVKDCFYAHLFVYVTGKVIVNGRSVADIRKCMHRFFQLLDDKIGRNILDLLADPLDLELNLFKGTCKLDKSFDVYFQKRVWDDVVGTCSSATKRYIKKTPDNKEKRLTVTAWQGYDLTNPASVNFIANDWTLMDIVPAYVDEIIELGSEKKELGEKEYEQFVREQQAEFEWRRSNNDTDCRIPEPGAWPLSEEEISRVQNALKAKRASQA
jgi:hypothetical protein